MIHIILILSILYRISTYLIFSEHYFHYNINDIILISLHHTAGPSHCLFIDIYNNFVVFTTDKPRLFTVVIWLHHILCQQYGRTLRLFDLQTQRSVKFIDIYNMYVVITTNKPRLFTVVIRLHRIIFQQYGKTRCILYSVIIYWSK